MRHRVTLPGRLYMAVTALSALEDEMVSQGALNAWAAATEKRQGRGSTYTVIGTPSPLSEVLAVLQTLVREMDEGLWSAKDPGVETRQLRASASQEMEPYEEAEGEA